MLGLPPRDRYLAEYIESCRIVKNSRAAQQKRLNWDDFNAIFCKAIFKFTLITTAKRLQQSLPSKKNGDKNEANLQWKISQTRR